MRYQAFVRARRFGSRSIGSAVAVYVAGITAAVILSLLVLLLPLLAELIVEQWIADGARGRSVRDRQARRDTGFLRCQGRTLRARRNVADGLAAAQYGLGSEPERHCIRP